MITRLGGAAMPHWIVMRRSLMGKPPILLRLASLGPPPAANNKSDAFLALIGACYYFGDNIESVRVITDTTGNVQRESDYYAFGGELPVVTTLSDVRKFNSKKRDTETALDYSHFRMSNSTLGRWQSVDPVGADIRQPQTLNRYAYVANNPVNKIDPQGLFGLPGGDSSTTVIDPNGGITVNTVVNVTDTADPVPLDGGEVGGGGSSAARLPYHPFLDTPTFGPRNPGATKPKPQPKQPICDKNGYDNCVAKVQHDISVDKRWEWALDIFFPLPTNLRSAGLALLGISVQTGALATLEFEPLSKVGLGVLAGEVGVPGLWAVREGTRQTNAFYQQKLQRGVGNCKNEFHCQ